MRADERDNLTLPAQRPALDQQARQQRDHTARLKAAAFALERPDPAAFLAEVLAALGLDQPDPLTEPARGGTR